MKKNLSAFIIIALIISAVFTGCGKSTVASNLTTSTIHTDSILDFSVPENIVATQSYVFVGKLVESKDYQTEYEKSNAPESIKEYDDTGLTVCNILVLKNLKGNLKEGSEIEFFKAGGINVDKKTLEIYENDYIPETGDICIFMGYAHEDGAMSGGGEYATIKLEDGITEENLDGSALVKEYVEHIKNQTVINLDSPYYSYLSRYDENYNK